MTVDTVAELESTIRSLEPGNLVRIDGVRSVVRVIDTMETGDAFVVDAVADDEVRPGNWFLLAVWDDAGDRGFRVGWQRGGPEGGALPDRDDFYELTGLRRV